jgi:tRNA(fMet)-specific endonuclease VapC
MQQALLIDTDVCSYLFRDDTRAAGYRPLLENNLLCLSFQTIAELHQWASLRRWGEARRVKLAAWLRQFVILSPTILTAEHWGRIRASAQHLGRPMSPQDAWIAACALEHDLPLLTHNVKHFSEVERLRLVTLP